VGGWVGRTDDLEVMVKKNPTPLPEIELLPVAYHFTDLCHRNIFADTAPYNLTFRKLA
jgi:hypothetical protein